MSVVSQAVERQRRAKALARGGDRRNRGVIVDCVQCGAITAKGGRLELQFTSDEDLERLIHLLESIQ